MQNVALIIKYLSQNSQTSSQLSQAQQTLLHYLAYFAEPEQDFDEALLEDFFSHCLDYAHWQQNKTQLSQEIEEFLETVGTQHILGLSLTDIKWPHETQIIEIENQRDMSDVLQCYLNTVCKQKKYRLINDIGKRMLAIILHPDHSLSIQMFDRKMMIRHGQVEPLKKSLQLHYTANLELKTLTAQRLELAPFVTAQFRINERDENFALTEQNNSMSNDSLVSGNLVRGYLAQKIYTLNSQPLNAFPKLFFAIKRLEQHFIHRQSDPFYQNVISSLERSIDLIKRQDPEAIKGSMDVLAQAQNAYEYVFHSDKLLSLLIKELQYTLSTRRTVVRTGQESYVDHDPENYSGSDEWTEITLNSEKTNRNQQQNIALKTAQKTALKRTQQNDLERKLGLQNQGSQNTNQNEAHNQSRLIIQNPELSLDLLEIDLSVSPNENDLRNQNLSKNQNSTTQKRTTTNLSSQPTTKTTRKYDLTN